MAPEEFRIPHSAFRTQTIYPVILPVPEEVADFKPRDRVKFLSRHARLALKISAQKNNMRLGKLEQDENGAPLPCNGIYWSITHKTHYVGGLVAPTPIGIDIERIRDCSRGLFAKTAGDREWALAAGEKTSLNTFFRYWTSKEALVKTSGIGLKDLLKCQVTSIIDDRHLKIRYSGQEWLIEHFYFEQHIASIVQGTKAFWRSIRPKGPSAWVLRS